VVPGDDDVREAAIPLEQFASGPALAARLSALRPGFEGTAADVLALAAGGDQLAGQIARSAGRASGAAIAHVVNVLDPELVVLGGGLGLAGGLYRDSLQQEMIRSIWADAHRDLPLVNAQLGRDAGWIGAGLAALA
jgi:glucokinase